MQQVVSGLDLLGFAGSIWCLEHADIAFVMICIYDISDECRKV
jgi:hypothetical protein